METQAYAIHAIWENHEDNWLRRYGVDPEASDEDLSRFKDYGYVHSSREPDAIRWRIKYLLNSPEDESQNTCTPGEGPSQDQHLYNSQPYTLSYPAVDPNYPTDSPGSFVDPATLQIQAVTQAPAASNTSSAPTYDSVQEAQYPDPPNEPGHRRRRRPQDVLAKEDYARFRDVLEENLPEMKRKLARGRSFRQINADYCPQCSYGFTNRFLTDLGCHKWSYEESKRIMDLQMELGDDWAQICGRLSSPARTKEEVEAHLRWLAGEASGEEEDQTQMH